MMTSNEAHAFALNKVEELRKDGIEVTIKKYNLDSEHGRKTVQKYDGEINRAHPERWVNVKFEISNKIDAEKVQEAANYLGMCGMIFDVGGTSDFRDWELDWSFQYTGKEDEEWREVREDVENMINDEDS